MLTPFQIAELKRVATSYKDLTSLIVSNNQSVHELINTFLPEEFKVQNRDILLSIVSEAKNLNTKIENHTQLLTSLVESLDQDYPASL